MAKFSFNVATFPTSGSSALAPDAPDPLAALEADCVEAVGVKCRTLAELSDPLPENMNPATLFHKGWLRKGSGGFLVSTSGTGKSVLSIQASILWTMGEAAFGIKPVRPLHIAIVQAEDDDEEVADFRNQITEGLIEAGYDRATIRAACGKIRLADATGRTGNGFIAFVEECLQDWPDVDLLIVNPFQSYFGGDISHNAELSDFLRTKLDPLIKPARAGVLFIHHTNKPPALKDRQGWGEDVFTAYAGAGGAELTNWARPTLTLMPSETVPGVFRLVAGKRWERLDWKDADGNKTRTRFFAHSTGRIFWREATPEEIAEAQGNVGGRKKADPEADARELAGKLRGKAMTLTDARQLAEQLFARTRGRLALDCLRTRPEVFGVVTVQAKWKAAIFIGSSPVAEAAARAYDAEMQGASGKG